MRLVLAATATTYNLRTLMTTAASGGNASFNTWNVSRLTIQFPAAAVEAANAGLRVGIGNASNVDIAAPANVGTSLEEGESVLYGMNGHICGVSLLNKWLNASGDNAVIYVDYE